VFLRLVSLGGYLGHLMNVAGLKTSTEKPYPQQLCASCGLAPDPNGVSAARPAL
jgi:hypothetical protein